MLFVDGAIFVRMTCSCVVRLRYTMGFIEDATTSKNTGRATCPKLALHSKRRNISLLLLLRIIRVLGWSSSVTDRDALRGRIATVERLLRETTTSQMLKRLTRATRSKSEKRTDDPEGVDRLRMAGLHEPRV